MAPGTSPLLKYKHRCTRSSWHACLLSCSVSSSRTGDRFHSLSFPISWRRAGAGEPLDRCPLNKRGQEQGRETCTVRKTSSAPRSEDDLFHRRRETKSCDELGYTARGKIPNYQIRTPAACSPSSSAAAARPASTFPGACSCRARAGPGGGRERPRAICKSQEVDWRRPKTLAENDTRQGRSPIFRSLATLSKTRTTASTSLSFFPSAEELQERKRTSTWCRSVI